MTETREHAFEKVRAVETRYTYLFRNELIRERVGISIPPASYREAAERLFSLARESNGAQVDVYEIYAGIRAIHSVVRIIVHEIRPWLRMDLARPREEIEPELRVALQLALATVDNHVPKLVEELTYLHDAVRRLDEETNGLREAAPRDETGDLEDLRSLRFPADLTHL